MFLAEMNVSKLTNMLTTSSCVFVPVDDPNKDVLDEISEVNSCCVSANFVTVQMLEIVHALFILTATLLYFGFLTQSILIHDFILTLHIMVKSSFVRLSEFD